MYYPLSAMKRYSYEIFEEYCRNAAILKDKEQQFEKLSAKFDVLYRKTNYAFIQKTKNSELYVLIDKIRDLVWDLNTLVKFSIYFDKEMCLETINKTGLKISDHRLNEIWERATTPIALSFEKRRMLHLLTLIRENYAWDVISERCQYFEANYHHVASIVEVTKKLKSTYGNLSKNQALKILQKENTELRQRHKDFNQWFKTLTKDEQLVVVYLQKVIELRDERKDDLNKAIVLFYRIAQKTFKEANIPEELIYYYTLDEIIKGKGHLIANKDSLFKRKKGFCAIITHDNQQHFEYGFYKENKRILEEQYRAQETAAHSDNMLKGQTGASGKIRGVVKVIRNLFADQYKFNQGDILVTGMTRPEFVPLMKKASGIITDEGGITCHAVIIARELKKPCVVGTKIATQVLKDNDYVEVDADKGIVHVLRQSLIDIDALLHAIQSIPQDIQIVKGAICGVDIVFTAYVNANKIRGVRYQVQYVYVHDRHCYQVTPIESQIAVAKSLIRFSRSNKNAFRKLIADAENYQRRIDALYRTKGKNGSLEVFVQLRKMLLEWWEYALLADDKGQGIEEELAQLLNKHKTMTESHIKDFIAKVSHPKEQSALSKERQAFYELCREYSLKHRQSAFKKLLNDYQQEYFYTKTNFAERTVLTPQIILKEIHDELRQRPPQSIEKNLKSMKAQFMALQSQRRSLIERAKLSSLELQSVEFAQEFSAFVDDRKTSMLKNNYYYFDMLHRLCEDRGLQYEDIGAYTSEEILEILRGTKKINPHESQRRRQNTFVVYGTGFSWGSMQKGCMTLQR